MLDAKVDKKQLNWADLGFQYVKTDSRFSAVHENGSWSNGSLLNSEIIAVHEGAPALHYAQQCFEGMKAQTAPDGRVLLFRPDLNSERFNLAASRLLMPEVPAEMFMSAVEETVRANYAWIPPYGSGASLYVRPMLIGVGENLGLKPAQQFEFRVFVSPVGPYYKSAGLAVISLAVSEMDRAAPSGTGSFKIGANYAGGLLATRRAQELGANEALYLDSAERRYIDEAGSANIIIATNSGCFVSPKSRAILPSITRRSIMTLARDELNLQTEDRPIDLRAEFDQFEEMAACGTAAVLSPVGRIWFDEDWHNIYQDGQTVGPVMQELYDLLVGIQKGEVGDQYGWLHEVSI
ncbi:MAG: branched-chain amino acid aminotransferase [Gammaproteobacteria bacterium]|jgi:branched-chain amino acid aminotransferase|nr:branched chain amino acid aminotransferase [Gammaproteobacteria bacterium]MDP6097578.1 branched-chain amino acid aminotransferase [Gammaproteobacteria bacterium]MDP7455797.1 branched-chain amino acid aminotransferase [Gammaproteobacteria bacterium]HJO11511.1 branched-chain amino acid aminotransferase [Gammaproteobacteria bacterium]|tara:strand:- start:496 stop:1545 length:1050 start_codon:yes stop_codon:yes gene_type:complete